MLLEKTFLHRMQLPAFRESFDCEKVLPIGLYREYRARLHRLSIKNDGAGSAVAGIATNMRPSQA
jgi:hypothetical protein